VATPAETTGHLYLNPRKAVLTLETERLRLRPFHETDLDAYAAICADPEVMRYVGDRGVLTREDAWRQMAMLLGHWQLRGFGMWAVEERATSTLVGRVGLHYPEGWPDREIGWTLARPYWGRGFAFEAARAALTHAFEALRWERAISVIDPDNHRSIRLAERLGERFDHASDVRGHRASIYSVSREAWRAAAGHSGDDAR
jgi:RimJ/RimL family protein N-acetyltransferase